jgi:CRISPR-associated endonuclease/helicase Cas3
MFSVERVNELLGLCVQGHHGGLQAATGFVAWLRDAAIAQRAGVALEVAARELPALETLGRVEVPLWMRSREDGELLVRMLFSCLVDADFLDTESHFDSGSSDTRATAFDAASLHRNVVAYRATLEHTESSRAVREVRSHIAASCERAAERAPGLFRLTAPTGGGKTIASLAFALRHAARHGHQRVVVAIPYTSIIDQTARTYRAALGDARSVVEHHSAVRPDDRDDHEPTADANWARLAAENWDAPVIVTTTVQLFESLFGNQTSTCRKLHNLTRSVLVLDEVQMLPAGLLDPILDVLRDLVDHYGTTVVLSTATPPRYSHPRFADVEEIVDDPEGLFLQLERVTYEFPDERWSWDEVASRLADQRQAMAVLNTKRDAVALVQALADQGVHDVFHLSTLLCGAHRADVLDRVNERLARGERCLLVATQVVEAGVDLDFPAVFRAMGPLDRIIQAAGRCNRNGRMSRGRVVVFRPEAGGLPSGVYRTATEMTAGWFRLGNDVHDVAAVSNWFHNLYGTVRTDKHEIQRLRSRGEYPEVARLFRMVEDDTEDVIVPYPAAGGLPSVERTVDALANRTGSARELRRALGPYVVALRRRAVERARDRGLVEPVIDGLWSWRGGGMQATDGARYDARLGLRVDGSDEELLLV